MVLTESAITLSSRHRLCCNAFSRSAQSMVSLAGGGHPGVGDEPTHQHVGDDVGIAGRLRQLLRPVQMSCGHRRIGVIAVPDGERGQHPGSGARVVGRRSRRRAPAAPAGLRGRGPAPATASPRWPAAARWPPVPRWRRVRRAAPRPGSARPCPSTRRPRPARECASSIDTTSASRSPSSRADKGRRSYASSAACHHFAAMSELQRCVASSAARRQASTTTSGSTSGCADTRCCARRVRASSPPTSARTSATLACRRCRRSAGMLANNCSRSRPWANAYPSPACEVTTMRSSAASSR